MAATPEQIARLRALTNEPTTDTYSDLQIAAAIERYPVVDALGQSPFVWSTAIPPAQEANPNWIVGYDLNSAAADIWEEKAAVVASDYDFDAPRDDGAYQRSQVYKQYMAQARYYRSRRSPGVIEVITPTPPVPSVVGNWNNPYE